MKKVKPLNYKHFRQKLNATELNFKTTEEIKSIIQFVGQKRALEALRFGIGIKSQGYNLYAMGPSGIGKRSLVSIVLSESARKSEVPSDWCYIHNFEKPERPIALQLEAGMGKTLQEDMNELVDVLGVNIITVFEGDLYQSRMKKINNYFNNKRKKLIKKTNLDKTPLLYKEQHEKERALETALVTAVVTPIIRKLKRKYKSYPNVLNYFSAVQKDIICHVSDFIKHDEKTNLFTFSIENPVLTKYKVNLLVDNSHLKGAPIIFEETPTYSTLISRIEHATHLGSQMTNFTLIKPGDLHRANGGYLIIEAHKLKKERDAWEALKSALYCREIRIKPHESSSVKPISLDPMPIPLDIKVILMGSRNTYYGLCEDDPDFTELFKVAVDFDEEIDRNKKNIKLYSYLIGTIAKREKLRSFHAGAVSAIIDYSTRIAGDIEKLSTHLRNVEDLILESDYWAGFSNKKIVSTADVKRAIDAQIHRMDRARELYYEDIARDFIIINTEGKSIGQVNCLSVRKVGNFSYGHPTRVTARVRMGKGKLIDIQREINMAGPLHSKASLTIVNFLASRFNQNHPFALSASLSFEQIYCMTDGDSASVGELCALLSALAEVPIYQFLAITGSIDQYGEVQAIGGVNEKIEGFFDVCKTRGLSGKQGVIIPAVNQQTLMLREDIVNAAKAKKFFIYPIKTIDEAIILLTGFVAGERDQNGVFPKGTLYHKIEKRLREFSKNVKVNV